jgi:hypothetical protein
MYICYIHIYKTLYFLCLARLELLALYSSRRPNECDEDVRGCFKFTMTLDMLFQLMLIINTIKTAIKSIKTKYY